MFSNFTFIGGTKICKLESVLLQKVLRIEQTNSKPYVQELLEKDVTYEELEVLFGRDPRTKKLSKNLREKLEKSELISACIHNLRRTHTFALCRS